MKRLALIILFLLLFCPAIAQEQEMFFRSAQVYTDSDIILDSDHRADLLRLVEKVTEPELRYRTSLAVVDKTVRDYAHLRSISHDLHSLSELSMAHLEESELAAFNEQLDAMSARMERSRPIFNHPASKLTEREVDLILQSSLQFFDQDAGPNQHTARDVMANTIAGLEPGWEKLYLRLLEAGSPEELNKEERTFLKVYGRVRMYLALVSGARLN